MVTTPCPPPHKACVVIPQALSPAPSCHSLREGDNDKPIPGNILNPREGEITPKMQLSEPG